MATPSPRSEWPPSRRDGPRPPPHWRIRAESQRRERWRDLRAAACVLGAVLLVTGLLPPLSSSTAAAEAWIRQVRAFGATTVLSPVWARR